MPKRPPAPILTSLNDRFVTGWTPTQATKVLLASRGCARPAATVAGLLRRLLAVGVSCGEPGPLQLDQFFWVMAFNDWVYYPPRPSDAEDLVQAEAILTKALNGPRTLPEPSKRAPKAARR